MEDGNDDSSESTINDAQSSDLQTSESDEEYDGAAAATRQEQERDRQPLHEAWQHQLQQAAALSACDPEQPSQQLGGVWQLELQQSVEHARSAEVVKVEEEELRPVCPQVLTHLQVSLAGPLSSGKRGVRMWTCAGSALNGFIASYLSILFMNQLYDPGMWFLQLTILPVWGGIGVLAGEYTALMGRALLDVGGAVTEKLLVAPAPAESRRSSADQLPPSGTNFRFLLELLKSPVSAEVGAQV